MFRSLYKTLIDDLVGRNHSIMANEGIEHNITESLVYEARDNTQFGENGVGVSVHTAMQPVNMSSMSYSYSYANTSYAPLNTGFSMDYDNSLVPKPFHLLNNNEMTP